MRDGPAPFERLRHWTGAAERCRQTGMQIDDAVVQSTYQTDKFREVDAQTWIISLTAHRHRAANAAGLDPSLVKIQMGHC